MKGRGFSFVIRDTLAEILKKLLWISHTEIKILIKCAEMSRKGADRLNHRLSAIESVSFPAGYHCGFTTIPSFFSSRSTSTYSCDSRKRNLRASQESGS